MYREERDDTHHRPTKNTHCKGYARRGWRAVPDCPVSGERSVREREERRGEERRGDRRTAALAPP
jgi:hypothetical protein